MRKPLAKTCHADHSVRRSAPHIPTEVCENVIDMLLSGDSYSNISESTRTLRSCALVCRDWRVRSQKTLFYRVLLLDSTSFHQLSAILDVGQHLRGYIHEVNLIGYHLHTTASIFPQFPPVLAPKLPNLQQLRVVHFDTDPLWYPRPPNLPKIKTLQYIPLHPRFPAFLSSLKTLSVLCLFCTTFRSFNEFARILYSLPKLEILTCWFVHWITAGVSDPLSDFMKPPDCIARKRTHPAFLPKLRELSLWDIATYGAERLILACGPHLTRLSVTISPLNGLEESTRGGGIDLSPCTGLQELDLRLMPQFSARTHSDIVKQLLTSWNPQFLQPKILVFRPFAELQFTREAFADVLHNLGAISESWQVQTVVEPSDASDSGANHQAPCELHVKIHDWDAERQQWINHLERSFPTWAQSGRLHLDMFLPQFDFQWWATAKSSSEIMDKRPRRPNTPVILKTAIKRTLDVISRTSSASHAAVNTTRRGLRRLHLLPGPTVPRDAGVGLASLPQSQHAP